MKESNSSTTTTQAIAPDNAATKIICTVYRSSREKEMYLYVKREEKLSRVPEPLLEKMGVVTEVLTLKLYEGRKLARVVATDVLAAIAAKGYFLQLPPDKQAIHFTMGE